MSDEQVTTVDSSQDPLATARAVARCAAFLRTHDVSAVEGALDRPGVRDLIPLPPPMTTNPEGCEPITARERGQYTFVYRRAFELFPLLDLAGAGVTLACTPIVRGRLAMAADLRYDQRWLFQQLLVGDLASSMALAPAETATFTIKKTQRTKLNRSTLESSDSLESSESSIVDKDVLNVARSSTVTESWRIDGGAKLSIGPLSLGADSGFNRSAQAVASSTAEHIAEVTQRSARRLQTLQKIEVGRESEDLLESTIKRTISNPYRDRALSLNVFELYKRFRVTTLLSEVRPMLVLQIDELGFDAAFVLDHADFLEAALLDRALAAELKTALAARRTGLPQRTLATRYARKAFDLLFRISNVFNLDGATTSPGFLPTAMLPGVLDVNIPASSFDADRDDPCLGVALSNEVGRVFATLSSYFILLNGLSRAERDEMEIDLAVALAASITDDWAKVTPDQLEDLMDDDDENTEVFRRVPGFLSIVEQLLRPLLQPREEERAAHEAAARNDFVVGRVVNHLHCFGTYYVVRYLEYLSTRAHNHPLTDALRAALAQVPASVLPAGISADLLGDFDHAAGFLDGLQFAVPFRVPWPLQLGLSFVAVANDRPPITSQTQLQIAVPVVDVVVPTDGVHIEPVAGRCILHDVPPPRDQVSAEVSVRAGAEP